MPLINVRCSKPLSHSDEFLKVLSYELASLTGKPEQYVMALIQTDQSMTFAGSNEDCCYVEIKSIGSMNTGQISKVLCEIIEKEIQIRSNRIYINFENVNPTQWGFNGQTFG